MFLRRALRYRRSQAFVLAGISLLIGTCAVFAPWFARAVEQTVTTETLANQPIIAAWQLVAAPPPSSSGAAKPRPPEDLAQLIPADLTPLLSPPVYGQTVELGWERRGQSAIKGTLIWRDGYCEQLVLVTGRCPAKANEVIVSAVDHDAFGASVGEVLAAKSSSYSGRGRLTVVGIYRPIDNAALYWFGHGPTGHSRPERLTAPAESDDLLTDRATFDTGAWGHQSTLDTRPLPGVARADDLDRLAQATTDFEVTAAEQGVTAQNHSGLAGLVDTIQAERRQATTIIPLVMVQVAVFAVVVLALALAAVVDQRRPELAVARLRGASALQAWRSLTVELGTAVAAGLLAGVAVGFGLLLLVRTTWLNDASPLELPWAVPVALLVAVCVGLAVVGLTVRSVVRLPISTLLRRVVPRRRRALGVVDLIIIVLASAGLVAALSGGGRGPLPVLTPTLLALAVGLAFAHLLLPTAGLISRQALRNGRLGLALGALQVSRRPAVTRIVAVVAVATALVSFAGQASAVAKYNRDTRAGYETGADAVLATQAGDVGDFTKALDKVDADRNWLTPVVVARTASPDALRTMMIEPESFRRNGFKGDRLTDAEGFGLLAAPKEPADLVLRGGRLTVAASTGPMTPVLPETVDGEVPPAEPPAKSVILEARLVSLRNGSRMLVRFPPMALTPGKVVELTEDIDCLGGCRLLRLGVARDIGDSAGIKGDLVISKFGTEQQPSIPLGPAANWQQLDTLGGETGAISAKTEPGDGLTLNFTSTGSEQEVQHTSVPTTLPALVTPEFAVSDGTTIPGVDGLAVLVQKVDRLYGPVNRYSDRTAVVDLETVRRLGGTVAIGGTDFEVWLNSEGLANQDKIVAALAEFGITASLVERRNDRGATYGRSASALALQLTPVVGVVGWSLAIIVLLLMVVTSWRSRAQDYASLRITGVPAVTTGRAARWEQTGPVALAALLGTACGLIGAQIALPMIPLFTDTGQASPIPLDLGTNWTVALVLWLIGTAVLTTTTVLLGSGVNRRAGYSRIREELA